MIRQIVSCGAPNFLNNIAGRLTSILMNMLLVRLGGERAVSIYGILMYVEGVIQPLLYGMCDSLQPAVGCNWGAGEIGRVKAIERCCFTASAVLSLLSTAVILLFPEPIAVLFMGEAGGDFLAEMVFALQLFALTYLTRWFSFATQSWMLAIEKPLYASLISVSPPWCSRCCLSCFVALGLTGLWMNFAGTALLAALLAIWVLLRLRKSPEWQGK